MAEGAIAKLFVGKMKSYIKCVIVDYESSRSEEFNGKRCFREFFTLLVINTRRHPTQRQGHEESV